MRPLLGSLLATLTLKKNLNPRLMYTRKKKHVSLALIRTTGRNLSSRFICSSKTLAVSVKYVRMNGIVSICSSSNIKWQISVSTNLYVCNSQRRVQFIPIILTNALPVNTHVLSLIGDRHVYTQKPREEYRI